MAHLAKNLGGKFFGKISKFSKFSQFFLILQLSSRFDSTMRIPQISRPTNVSPKMFVIAPKTTLFRTIWLISEISHLITVFELTDLDLLKVYFFKFQSLRFEQWIEQVRPNFRHATTVRGPFHGTTRVRSIHMDHPLVQSHSCLDGFSQRTFLGPWILRPVRMLSSSPLHRLVVTDHGQSVVYSWLWMSELTLF